MDAQLGFILLCVAGDLFARNLFEQVDEKYTGIQVSLQVLDLQQTFGQEAVRPAGEGLSKL
jgi:hypothetical protein